MTGSVIEAFVTGILLFATLSGTIAFGEAAIRCHSLKGKHLPGLRKYYVILGGICAAVLTTLSLLNPSYVLGAISYVLGAILLRAASAAALFWAGAFSK